MGKGRGEGERLSIKGEGGEGGSACPRAKKKKLKINGIKVGKFDQMIYFAQKLQTYTHNTLTYTQIQTQHIYKHKHNTHINFWGGNRAEKK